MYSYLSTLARSSSPSLDAEHDHDPSLTPAAAFAKGWDAALQHILALPSPERAKLLRTRRRYPVDSDESDSGSDDGHERVRREGALMRRADALARWAADMQQREDALRCHEIGANRDALRAARELQVREEEVCRREEAAVRRAEELSRAEEAARAREEAGALREDEALRVQRVLLRLRTAALNEEIATPTPRAQVQTPTPRPKKKNAKLRKREREEREKRAIAQQLVQEEVDMWWCDLLLEESDAVREHDRWRKETARARDERGVMRRNSRAGRVEKFSVMRESLKARRVGKALGRKSKSAHMYSYWQVAA
ncbi:hypothetical protein FA95DRAFT_988085 [Auriscalpium vulgare]|uniref:Uncharacterized protein n=1 Tax=Auriscalpium vulgare TaxID=40419 RepID=A0ACB8RZ72_9AGAM|nr:hypothetical protein FA95DRAFT_988085 [Auriscalpium vulgare]